MWHDIKIGSWVLEGVVCEIWPLPPTLALAPIRLCMGESSLGLTGLLD